MRPYLLIVSLALSLVACGNAGNVGSHCDADNDCDQSDHLVCNTSLPQGYCTIPCATPGQIGACPGNSVCGLVNNTPMCLHICNTQLDCRINYGCNGVTASNVKACQP